MIQDLISKLKEEAAAGAQHKAWCDEQLKDNELKRGKKTTKIEELTASIDKLEGEIKSKGETVEMLVKEQADLAKDMEEATIQREKEKTANLDTIADAQAGSAAVNKAVLVLEEFYAKQASLLQQGLQQVPEMEAYKGMQRGSKGVIGMLEVIESDFVRLEADTKAAEEQASREYDSFMSKATADNKVKHDSEVKLKLEKDQAEFKTSQLETDLAANKEELAKADTYFEYLKPNCLKVHVSFEKRAAKRKDELAALNEAWEIFDKKSG